MSFSGIIANDSRQEQSTDVIAHWDDPRVPAGDLVAFLHSCDRAIEIRIRCGNDTPDKAI